MANYCIILATIIYLTSCRAFDIAHSSSIPTEARSLNNPIHDIQQAMLINEILDDALMPARKVRTPAFNVHEMSTARGYGKRHVDYNLHGWESHLLERLIGYQDNKRGNSHGIDLREPRLRFRMENDSGLRIGRGFGKRSVLVTGQKEECKLCLCMSPETNMIS